MLWQSYFLENEYDNDPFTSQDSDTDKIKERLYSITIQKNGRNLQITSDKLPVTYTYNIMNTYNSIRQITPLKNEQRIW